VEKAMEDPFETTVKRRLPLLIAILSTAFLVPALMLAMVSPMAMAGGPSAAGWAFVILLISQPFLLAGAAVAGFLCYRRFNRTRFIVALGLPALCILGMIVTVGA
jgi:peptidoglycan/LPS O-acetylase OafA/YrhL